jgi:molybdopterin-guanine dinucleotide biosynthesis protein MobB
MKIFGLAGWSGSGKTTLMEGLLRHLVGLGYRVSTLKHTHHGIDLDSPGKDTFRHRQAGATEVVLLSASRWVVMHELRNGEGEPRPEDLARRLTPVDLLLVEGFKSIRHPKIEIHRPELGNRSSAGRIRRSSASPQRAGSPTWPFPALRWTTSPALPGSSSITAASMWAEETREPWA